MKAMARNDILSTRNLHVNRDIFLYEPENKTNCDSQKEGQNYSKYLVGEICLKLVFSVV